MRELLSVVDQRGDRQLAVLGLLLGNLEMACEKILRPNLANAFHALARSCAIQSRQTTDGVDRNAGREEILNGLLNRLVAERKSSYVEGLAKASAVGNRAVLRSFTWGQKVTAIQGSLLKRFLKSGGELLKDGEQVHICEACGFVTVKGEIPESCPICKAPSGTFYTL